MEGDADFIAPFGSPRPLPPTGEAVWLNRGETASFPGGATDTLALLLTNESFGLRGAVIPYIAVTNCYGTETGQLAVGTGTPTVQLDDWQQGGLAITNTATNPGASLVARLYSLAASRPPGFEVDQNTVAISQFGVAWGTIPSEKSLLVIENEQFDFAQYIVLTPQRTYQGQLNDLLAEPGSPNDAASGNAAQIVFTGIQGQPFLVINASSSQETQLIVEMENLCGTPFPQNRGKNRE